MKKIQVAKLKTIRKKKDRIAFSTYHYTLPNLMIFCNCLGQNEEKYNSASFMLKNITKKIKALDAKIKGLIA